MSWPPPPAKSLTALSQDVYAAQQVPLTVIGSGSGPGPYPVNPNFSTISFPLSNSIIAVTEKNRFDIRGAGEMDIVGAGDILLQAGSTMQVNGTDISLRSPSSISMVHLAPTGYPTASIAMASSTINLVASTIGISGAVTASTITVPALTGVSTINGARISALTSFQARPALDFTVSTSNGLQYAQVIPSFRVAPGAQYQVSGQLFATSASWPSGQAGDTTTVKMRFPAVPNGQVGEFIDTGVSYASMSTTRAAFQNTNATFGAFNFTGAFTAGNLVGSSFAILYVPPITAGTTFTYNMSTYYGQNPTFPVGWTVTDIGALSPLPSIT